MSLRQNIVATSLIFMAAATPGSIAGAEKHHEHGTQAQENTAHSFTIAVPLALAGKVKGQRDEANKRLLVPFDASKANTTITLTAQENNLQDQNRQRLLARKALTTSFIRQVDACSTHEAEKSDNMADIVYAIIHLHDHGVGRLYTENYQTRDDLRQELLAVITGNSFVEKTVRQRLSNPAIGNAITDLYIDFVRTAALAVENLEQTGALKITVSDSSAKPKPAQN